MVVDFCQVRSLGDCAWNKSTWHQSAFFVLLMFSRLTMLGVCLQHTSFPLFVSWLRVFWSHNDDFKVNWRFWLVARWQLCQIEVWGHFGLPWKPLISLPVSQQSIQTSCIKIRLIYHSRMHYLLPESPPCIWQECCVVLKMCFIQYLWPLCHYSIQAHVSTEKWCSLSSLPAWSYCAGICNSQCLQNEHSL